MDPRTMLAEAKRTWQPPPELQHSCPREVRLTGAGRALLTIAVICFLTAPLAGVILHIKATGDHAQRRELIASGAEGRAAVTRRWMRRGDHPRYFVDYVYEAAGRELTGRVEVGRSTWNRLEQGSVLPVRYLPLNPQRHLVPGLEDQLTPLWLPYLISGVLAAAGWLLTLPLKSSRRLLSEGRPVPGIVLDHRKAQHLIVVRYAFATMSGAIVEGKTEAQKNPPPVGSILCVLYEQDNARRNRAYPLSLHRIDLS